MDADENGDEGLITAREVAQMLGVSASTVLDHWEAGDLPGFRLFPKQNTRGRATGPVRFRRSEIETLIEEWRVTRPPS